MQSEEKEKKLAGPKETVEDCSSCAAPCCRAPYRVYLSYKERKSGKYEYEMLYPEGGQTVLKQVNGHCLYLDPDQYICKIYSERPSVCRSYGCTGDDRLTPEKKCRVKNAIRSLYVKEDQSRD